MAGRRSVVQVEVAADLAELAADALWQARPSAVLEVPLDGGRVRLTADVADVAGIDPSWAAVVLQVDEDGYLDAWRTWATPIRAGRRVVLQPAWVPPLHDRRDDLVVVLDPGRAFGSGSHESTRLAVAAIEDLVERDQRVLDVGCGSGVLAVVAARLGAAEVVAVDVAPEAVAATAANAAANGVAGRVRAIAAAPLAEVGAPFDLVVANIGGRTLFDLADELVAAAAPGGRLVLSGILEGQLDRLVATCTGCRELQRRGEAGWGAVVLSRGSSG